MDWKTKVEGKSIALVGNSLSSLEQRNGRAIDAADFVIRCNRGFQKCDPTFKGEKTNALILGSPGTAAEYSVFGARLEKLDFIIWTKTAESGLRLPAAVRNHPGYILFDAERRMHLRKKFLDDWWPTAGFMAFDLLISNPVWKRLDIYGFDFFRTGTSYHGMNRAKKWHNPGAERTLVLHAAKKFKEKVAIHGHERTG